MAPGPRGRNPRSMVNNVNTIDEIVFLWKLRTKSCMVMLFEI